MVRCTSTSREESQEEQETLNPSPSDIKVSFDIPSWSPYGDSSVEFDTLVLIDSRIVPECSLVVLECKLDCVSVERSQKVPEPKALSLIQLTRKFSVNVSTLYIFYLILRNIVSPYLRIHF